MTFGSRFNRRVHPTFADAYVIPTQVGIHAGARSPPWIPVCTGMTG